MERESWLADPDVAGFVRYLRDVVYGVPGSFVQQYRPRRPDERHRHFDISCFGEAVASYWWAGMDLLESAALVADAGTALRESVARRDHGGVLARCVEVVAWCGVHDAAAKCLVRRYDAGALPLDIELAAANLLADNDTTSEAFRDNVLLRSDAAMTKVYSAQNANSIVYDERVGAALGRLASEYLTLAGLERVPDALAFMVGAERRRNPSSGTRRFSSRRTGAPHALWNQRTNWLVAELVADPRRGGCGFFPIEVHPHRVVEAGLFMIGYDIATIVCVEVPISADGRRVRRDPSPSPGRAPSY